MQLPQPTAHYSRRVSYGRYVARRLKRAGYIDLAAEATRTSVAVRTTGRAWDDADDLVQDALADRDAADAALDFTAQGCRNTLAGRALNAAQKEPYTRIFPKGVGYYIAAPQGEENARYSELAERIEKNLPADDALRDPTVHAIQTGLEEFTAGTKALEKAHRVESLAGTELDRATERWERQMEKTYGALVAELGRAAAEKFFPKVRTRARGHDHGDDHEHDGAGADEAATQSAARERAKTASLPSTDP